MSKYLINLVDKLGKPISLKGTLYYINTSSANQFVEIETNKEFEVEDIREDVVPMVFLNCDLQEYGASESKVYNGSFHYHTFGTLMEMENKSDVGLNYIETDYLEKDDTGYLIGGEDSRDFVHLDDGVQCVYSLQTLNSIKDSLLNFKDGYFIGVLLPSENKTINLKLLNYSQKIDYGFNEIERITKYNK